MSIKTVRVICAAIAAFGFAAAASASASVVYETGLYNPWGQTTNDAAMNTAFGNGQWTKTNGFNAGLFNGASFVFLDGSDSDAIQLNNFLAANRNAIDAYVNNGGNLFINAAPNQGGSINFGFGVTLNYPAYSGSATVTADGVAAGLTNGGIATTYGGSYFSHGSVSGGGISDLVHGNAGTIFGAKAYGRGFVAFGGQTTTNFHWAQPDANRLLVNELQFVAGHAAVPEPASIALLGVGLLGFAASRRRKQ